MLYKRIISPRFDQRCSSLDTAESFLQLYLGIGDRYAGWSQAIHSGTRVACVRVIKPANPDVVDLDCYYVVNIVILIAQSDTYPRFPLSHPQLIGPPSVAWSDFRFSSLGKRIWCGRSSQIIKHGANSQTKYYTNMVTYMLSGDLPRHRKSRPWQL